MSIIWRIIGAVSIILGIIGKKKKEIPESIIGRFWSIIDLKIEFISLRIYNKTVILYSEMRAPMDLNF